MYGAANGPYNASPVTTAPDSPSVKSRGYNPQIDDRYGLPLVVRLSEPALLQPGLRHRLFYDAISHLIVRWHVL